MFSHVDRKVLLGKEFINNLFEMIDSEQLRLKNLHRQAFSEESAANQQQMAAAITPQPELPGRTSLGNNNNNGGDPTATAQQQAQGPVVGQIGTGTADNIAFWVPPTVVGRTSRRYRTAMLRNNMTFDCGDASPTPFAQSAPSANSAMLASSVVSLNQASASNNNNNSNFNYQQVIATPPASGHLHRHHNLPHPPDNNNGSTDQIKMAHHSEGDNNNNTGGGITWSSVSNQLPASMDLFKKFTEKTVEVKNMILGNEALSSITSAVNTAVNIGGSSSDNNSSNGGYSSSQQQLPPTSPHQTNIGNGANNIFTNHNTLDASLNSSGTGEPPPVVIPTLQKKSSTKGLSMHQAIDFRKINTNLYDGEKKRMPTGQQSNVDVDQSDDEVGTVKLIFEYQRSNGIFVVTVDNVQGLPAPSEGVESELDPFCHVQLLPDKRVIATKVLRGSLNPDFHEQIMFDVAGDDDLPNRILELTVAHRDQSATGLIIGFLRLALNSFDFVAKPGPTEVYRPLNGPDKREGTKALGGNLLFSVSYLATAKRLTVYVHEAKGLRFCADDASTSSIEATVRVTLVIDGKKSRKRKTATQHGVNVVWNEAVTFTDIAAETLTSGRLQAIDVEVAHESLLGDKTLGHIIISPSSVPTAQAHWQAMRQGDDTPRWQRLRFTT